MMPWFFLELWGKIKPKNLSALLAIKFGVSKYYATDRNDLTAEQIATIYKLRWTIESFFKWWKEHLKVYHLIVRNKYGLMVEILGGLITYLLMAIYCQEEYNDKDIN